MAVKSITNIYLYTDNSDASVAARRFMEDNDVRFIHLNYWDPAQHDKVFGPLRTWTFKSGPFEVDSFPFVIFEVIDDSTPKGWPNPHDFIAGDIPNSQIVQLSRLK